MLRSDEVQKLELPENERFRRSLTVRRYEKENYSVMAFQGCQPLAYACSEGGRVYIERARLTVENHALWIGHAAFDITLAEARALQNEFALKVVET